MRLPGAVVVTALAALAAGAPARAEELSLACLFPTAPALVFRYVDGVPVDLRVAERAPVPFTETAHAAPLALAEDDGLEVRFSAVDGVVEIDRDGDRLLREEGRCAVVGGPVRDRPVEIAAPPADLPGKWQVAHRGEDAAGPSVALALPAEGQPDAALRVGCEGGTATVAVLPGRPVSEDGIHGQVAFRIDDDLPRRLRWQADPEGTALGMWHGGLAVNLLARIARGQRLSLGILPADGAPLDLTFDIRGFDRAVAPLREACAW